MKEKSVLKLLESYGTVAPRYTSYPSAAHFQSEFSPSVYEQFLTGQSDGIVTSIYIHIPFCRSLCHYCGCFTRVVHDDNPIHDYLNLLEKEICLVGSMTNRRLLVSHIHFGGGSPNLLREGDIKRLLGLVRDNFNLQKDAEIAMECDPRQMTEDKAKGYALAGVNRVSLGVQDFNEKTQKVINRVQPFSQIAACMAWLRSSGITNINFDLIYGLPYQTPETVADNAHKAAALGASRVAVFGYAHVPWFKPHQKILEKHHLPEAHERYEQAEAVRAILVEKGYEAVGMDHFSLSDDPLAVASRQGLLHRNFQGYTTDEAQAVIGFGPSAISRLPELYAQNTSSLAVYRKCMEQGRLPIDKGLCLSEEDRLRAGIIEQLMCYFTVDAGEICKMHGFPPEFFDDSLQKVMEMEKDGLVERSGRIITVTEQGRYFVRSICACFDAYFQNVERKYARAV